MFVSTCKQHFIPGLLDASPESTNKFQFDSAGAGSRTARAVGPAAVCTISTEDGKPYFLIDPEGVLLSKPTADSSEMTVFAQMKLKSFGLPLRQCHNGTQDDVLLCLRSNRTVQLQEENGILVMQRHRRLATELASMKNIKLLVQDIAAGRVSPLVPAGMKVYHRSEAVAATISSKVGTDLQSPTHALKKIKTTHSQVEEMYDIVVPDKHNSDHLVLVLLDMKRTPYVCLHINVSKLTPVQLARLWHFRLSHSAPKVPYDMHRLQSVLHLKCPIILNEDCPGCDDGKFRVQPFPRRDYEELSTENLDPWEKVYFDGYGGQKSLGITIGGANGGFMFVCAKTNAWWKHLTRTTKHFPLVLRKFLLWVENQKFRTRMLISDTYSVNISAAATAVCDDFDAVLRPASAGSPQELGQAEKAIQDLRRMTRCSLASAPHLDKQLMWGLCDEWQVWVHYILPGPPRNKGMSPYEMIEGRKPDLKVLFLHPFGCPVSFKPMKNTPGWSSNKNEPIVVQGFFVGMQWPMVLVLRTTDNKVVSVSRRKVRCYESMYIMDPTQSPLSKHVVSIDGPNADEESDKMPSFVQSVTSPREADSLDDDAGENTPEPELPVYVPEEKSIVSPDEDSLLSKLTQKLKENKQQPTFTDALMKAMNCKKFTRPAGGCVNPEGGGALPHLEPGLDTQSIVYSEEDPLLVYETAPEEFEEVNISEQANAQPAMKKKRFIMRNVRVGHRDKVAATRFDSDTELYDSDTGEAIPKFSEGKDEFIYGKVIERGTGKHRDQLKILYDDDSEDEGTWSHYSHVLDAPIDDAIDIISEVALATAILPHDQPEEVPPRNFYECLVRDHWRDWVMAIKREMAGWVEFRAYENCFVKNLRGEKNHQDWGTLLYQTRWPLQEQIHCFRQPNEEDGRLLLHNLIYALV